MHPVTLAGIVQKIALHVLMPMILASIASLLRVWPLGMLGSALVWLTFYPMVMVAAISGGLFSGTVTVVMACIIVVKFWALLVPSPFITTSADWIGLGVFCFNGLLISGIAELMRRAERRTKLARLLAENANKAKSVFLANMSHELRTPLNTIIGYANLLKQSNLNDESGNYARIIAKSGEHLLSLINDIIDTSKIESGQLTLTLNICNVRALTNDLQEMFSLKVKDKGVQFTITVDKSVPEYILIDEKKFRMILINIIGNAVKFTDSGYVVVSITVVSNKDQQVLTINVQDTGAGIAPDELTQLFGYFVQTRSGKNLQSGSGLGLVISRNFARFMGGDITVKSEPGIGSTFTITIPFTVNATASAKERCEEEQRFMLSKGCKPVTILVAEDNDENRALAVKLLTRAGINVYDVSNGEDAVRVALEQKPQLILMDTRMPQLNGIDATKRLRELPQGASIKIIAVSAHALEDEVREILAAGCDAFIAKPFRENELFTEIEKLLAITFERTILQSKHRDIASALTYTITDEHNNGNYIDRLEYAANASDYLSILSIVNIMEKDDPICAQQIRQEAARFNFVEIKRILNNMRNKVHS